MPQQKGQSVFEILNEEVENQGFPGGFEVLEDKQPHPTTPEGVNALLAPGSTPVGQRTLTPTEEKLVTRPGRTGFAYAHPGSAPTPKVTPGVVDPRTRTAEKTMTPEQRRRAIALGLLDAAPVAAATATSFIPGAGPLLSIPAGMAGETIRRGGRALMGSGVPSSSPEDWGKDVPPGAIPTPGEVGKDVAMGGVMNALPVLAFELGIPLTKEVVSRLVTPADSKALDVITSLGVWGPAETQSKEHVYLLSDDLRRIAQAEKKTGTGVFDTTAKGGIVRDDFRIRRFVNDVGEYLRGMYRNEKLPEINYASSIGATVRLPGNPATIQQAADSLLTHLPNGDPLRQVVGQLSQNPTMDLAIADANEIAQHVNNLGPMRRAAKHSPSGQVVDLATSAKLSSLDALDEALGTAINEKLIQLGRPGLTQYEQRYAALSRLKEAYDRLAPATEAGRIIKPGEVGTASTSGISLRGRVATSLGQNPGRKLQNALDTLANSKEVGIAPNRLHGAPTPGMHPGPATPNAPIGRAGQLPPPPGPVTPQGQQPMPAQTPWGAPTPQRPPGGLQMPPVPPTPPGPPAIPPVAPGAPPPWSSLATPSGPMEPGNIAMTGIQEPLPQTPSVPATGMPPVAEPPRTLSSPFGPKTKVPGPAPQPASQMPLGASDFPNIQGTALESAERRLPGNASLRDLYTARDQAGADINTISAQLRDPNLPPEQAEQLRDALFDAQNARIGAQNEIDRMARSGAESPTPGAPQAHVIDNDVADAIREAGLPPSAHLGEKGGLVHIRTGYQTKPFVEGGQPGQVDIAFKKGEKITAEAIKKKIAERLAAFGDRIVQ